MYNFYGKILGMVWKSIFRSEKGLGIEIQFFWQRYATPGHIIIKNLFLRNKSLKPLNTATRLLEPFLSGKPNKNSPGRTCIHFKSTKCFKNLCVHPSSWFHPENPMPLRNLDSKKALIIFLIISAFPKGKFPFQVELGGVEPPSKQVTEMLSTCLVTDWLSGDPRAATPKDIRIL